MKANKLIVFAFIAILFATSMMTATRATAQDNSVSGDVTPAANPVTTPGWIPDQQVSHTAQDEVNPSIATAGDGSLWVAYQHYNATTGYWEIAVAKSTDGGVTWTLMYTLSAMANLNVPSIAVDVYTNNVYVVFQHTYTSTDHDIELLRYNGTGWYAEYVDYSTHDDYSPSIACEYNLGGSMGGGNYVFVTWERHLSSTDIELEFAESTDYGVTWPTEYALTGHGAGELTNQPSMTYTVNSTNIPMIYIAYTDFNTASGYYDISLLTSTNEGGSWIAPQHMFYLTSTPLSDPSITAVHGGATVVVAFTETFGSTNHEIYYGYSQNNGATWSSPTGMVTTKNAIDPQLTVDGMGGTGSYLGYIHATYEVMETVGSRINGMYYTEANYATPSSWSTAVQVADDNAWVAADNYPNVADRAITTVHNSVPVIVWTDYRNPSYDIYATTLGGKYTINTSPSGLTVSVDGTSYTAPQSFYWAYKSIHALSVTSPQVLYSFSSWSDGGAQSHSITANTLGETVIDANFVKTATYLVVRGADNRIYYCGGSSGGWGSWNSLPTGTTMDAPAAAVAPNKLYVVVRGSDGASLWFSSTNLISSSFSGWTLLSGTTPSTPTLTSNGDTLALVVRGGDNRIYFRTYNFVTSAWTGWTVLPSGTTLDTPAATLVGNTLYIVVRGSEGTSLWYSSIDTTGQGFSGWTLLSGSTPSTPTLTSYSTGLWLVVRGGDNRIYYRTYNIVTSAWTTSWTVLPTGTTLDTPAATILLNSLFQNSLYIVVRGSDGTSLWTSNINLTTSSFSGWTMLSGSTPSKPTLAS